MYVATEAGQINIFRPRVLQNQTNKQTNKNDQKTTKILETDRDRLRFLVSFVFKQTKSNAYKCKSMQTEQDQIILNIFS